MGIFESERSIRKMVWLGAFIIAVMMALAGLGFVKLVNRGGFGEDKIMVVTQPGGEARLVAERLFISSFVWSPDGEKIAFPSIDINPWRFMWAFLARRNPADPQSVLGEALAPIKIWDMGTGRTRLVSCKGMPSVLRVGSWSKAGDIYVEALPPSKSPSVAGDYELGIWSINATTGKPRRLTTGYKDSLPRVSPDGDKVAFIRDKSHVVKMLCVTPAFGGRATKLAEDVRQLGFFGWVSPYEVMFASRPNLRSERASDAAIAIKVADTRTGHVRTLAKVERLAGFCPVEREVAFASHFTTGAGRQSFGTRFGFVNMDTGRISVSCAMRGVTIEYLNRGPGRSLLFVVSNPRRTPGRGDVFQSDFRGRMVRLTSSGDVDGLSTSRDSSSMVFIRKQRSGRLSLWLMRLPRNLPHNPK